MQRGLFVAPFDVLADPRLIGDLAAESEAAGWDGFFVWDHIRYSEPVTAIADPWICMAAIALRTERTVFGPMVTPLPRRRPQVLARQAASLAVLSGGRLVLGFGIGDDWGAGEFGAFGDETDPKVRGRMLDEGLEVLIGLLSGAPVEHEGEHYRAQGVTFLPAPERPSRSGSPDATRTARRCTGPSGSTATSRSRSRRPSSSPRCATGSPATSWSTCSRTSTPGRGARRARTGC